jgi:hypothetical protein
MIRLSASRGSVKASEGRMPSVFGRDWIDGGRTLPLAGRASQAHIGISFYDQDTAHSNQARMDDERH